MLHKRGSLADLT